MKESHKKKIGTLSAGLIKLAKIIWIFLKSFFEAITWDFYNNMKKYWKKTFKKSSPVEIKETPKQPIP